MKEATVEAKTKKNNKLNMSKIADGIAKVVAYIALFVSASYGVRTMLNSIDEKAALVFTGLFVLGLTYIIFRNEK